MLSRISRAALRRSAGAHWCALSSAASATPGGTPAATRLSFAESAYGHGAHAHSSDDQALQALRGAYKKNTPPGVISKVHSRRSLFDSAQTIQAGDDGKTFTDVYKTPKTDTPDLTRLSVFDSDYGKEVMPSDAHTKVQGLSAKRDSAARVSAVHHRRAMFDSVLGHADDGKQFKDVVKEVKTGTPDVTRFSVFDSDYGKDVPVGAEHLVAGLKPGKRHAPSTVSKVHDTAKVFQHSDI